MTRKQILISISVLIIVIAAAFLGREWLRKGAAVPETAPRPAPAPTAGTPGDRPARAPVSIDTRRQQLIGVKTVKVTRSSGGQTIRAVGSVRFDETRLTDVNVKIDGWIRELFADYTGQLVSRGAPLLTLYSPDLAAAEQEYVLALNARDQLTGSVLPDAVRQAGALVAAARQRLGRWDLSADELRDLEASREPQDTMLIRAAASGVVLDKPAVQGAHVTPGQTLFKLADLSIVWVEADVYEQDLPSVRVGDRATVTLESSPGERQSGRVLYVYPYLDEQTRTNKVRFEFPNPRGHLKPGMFATVEIATHSEPTLVVPADAVLDSGREQLVFVAEGEGRFMPTPVTIGRRLGGDVQILKGLDEGEEVAGAAAFFLDSESQLQAAMRSYEPPSQADTASAASASSSELHITLRTTPTPPITGANQFAVQVSDAAGAPVNDAQVAIQLFMPAMPTMNMPAMRNEVSLSRAGAGLYRGAGQVLMAGTWTVTVTASVKGETAAEQTFTLAAK